MPHIDQIPSDEVVFIDTMIFVYHFKEQSQECTNFLYRVARKDIIAYVDTLVLSDLLHKLMLYEAHIKGFITNANARCLKQKLNTDPLCSFHLVDYHKHFRATVNIGVKMLQISKNKLIKSFKHRRDNALMTTDSLHVECISRKGIKNFVTKDSDFSKLTDFIIWEPFDV